MNKNLLLLGLLSCALTTPALAEDVENADKAKTAHPIKSVASLPKYINDT